MTKISKISKKISMEINNSDELNIIEIELESDIEENSNKNKLIVSEHLNNYFSGEYIKE